MQVFSIFSILYVGIFTFIFRFVAVTGIFWITNKRKLFMWGVTFFFFYFNWYIMLRWYRFKTTFSFQNGFGFIFIIKVLHHVFWDEDRSKKPITLQNQLEHPPFKALFGEELRIIYVYNDWHQWLKSLRLMGVFEKLSLSHLYNHN